MERKEAKKIIEETLSEARYVSLPWVNEKDFMKALELYSDEEMIEIVKEKILDYLSEKENEEVPFSSGWTYWFGCDLNSDFEKYDRYIIVLSGNSKLSLSQKIYCCHRFRHFISTIEKANEMLNEHFLTGYTLSAVKEMISKPENDWDQMDHGNPFCSVTRTIIYLDKLKDISEGMNKVRDRYYEMLNVEIDESLDWFDKSRAKDKVKNDAKKYLYEQLLEIKGVIEKKFKQLTEEIRKELK